MTDPEIYVHEDDPPTGLGETEVGERGQGDPEIYVFGNALPWPPYGNPAEGPIDG